MKKSTKKDLAATYLELTGTKAPTKWNRDKLEEEVTSLQIDINQPTSEDTIAAYAEIVEVSRAVTDKPPVATETDTPQVKTVHCECCGVERPVDQTWSLAVGQHYCEAGYGCKVNQTPDTSPLRTAVKEVAKSKTAKKSKKTPKAKQVISYEFISIFPADDSIKVPRQMEVILRTLKRESGEDNRMLKSVLVETLEANNNNSTESVAAYTHDLKARQPALAILMHYQKKMIDNGQLRLIKE